MGVRLTRSFIPLLAIAFWAGRETVKACLSPRPPGRFGALNTSDRTQSVPDLSETIGELERSSSEGALDINVLDFSLGTTLGFGSQSMRPCSDNDDSSSNDSSRGEDNSHSPDNQEVDSRPTSPGGGSAASSDNESLHYPDWSVTTCSVVLIGGSDTNQSACPV